MRQACADLRLSLSFSLTRAWGLLHLAITRTSWSQGVQSQRALLASSSLKGEGGLIWLKPTVHAWSPRSRRRPPPLFSRCLNTRSIDRLGAHARGGGVPKGAAALLEVSKHQVDRCTWCPHPGRGCPRGRLHPPSGCLNTRATSSPPIGPHYLGLMPTPGESCAKSSAARPRCV